MNEVRNALEQANKEVGTRFDLKATGSTCKQDGDVITVASDNDFHLEQVVQVLMGKLAKRQVDLTCLEKAKPVESGKEVRQAITIRHGIDANLGRQIVKLVKDSKTKAQASIQDGQVRVTGKKKDELQTVIAVLRESKLDLPLQFKNFRD